MNLLRCLSACSIVAVLALGAPGADGAKKKKHHGVHGKVVAVDATSITVKVHHHKKKGATAAADQPTERKFTVTKNTTYEKVTGQKGTRQQAAATLADVTQGTHVVILPTAKGSGEAAKVLIEQHTGKKKAA
jgi:hypothetical protein